MGVDDERRLRTDPINRFMHCPLAGRGGTLQRHPAPRNDGQIARSNRLRIAAGRGDHHPVRGAPADVAGAADNQPVGASFLV